MKEERFPHTRKPLRRQRLRVAEGGASEPRGRAQQQGCGGQSRQIPTQRIGADQHSPAQEASGADMGWELQRSDPMERTGEHSLKGASAPQLAGRESRKDFGPG